MNPILKFSDWRSRVFVTLNLILKFSEWGSRVLPPANLILKFSEWGPRGFTINEFHSAIFRIWFTHFYHPRTLPANPILKFSEWGSRVFSIPGSRVFVTREPGLKTAESGWQVVIPF